MKEAPQCPCGWTTKAPYDRSTRRGRHVDMGSPHFFETEIVRSDWARCGRVRTEDRPSGSARSNYPSRTPRRDSPSGWCQTSPVE